MPSFQVMGDEEGEALSRVNLYWCVCARASARVLARGCVCVDQTVFVFVGLKMIIFMWL
jgi:hypothetical protein